MNSIVILNREQLIANKSISPLIIGRITRVSECTTSNTTIEVTAADDVRVEWNVCGKTGHFRGFIEIKESTEGTSITFEYGASKLCLRLSHRNDEMRRRMVMKPMIFTFNDRGNESSVNALKSAENKLS